MTTTKNTPITGFSEIDDKLAKLPMYLRYRAETIALNYECSPRKILDIFSKQGVLIEYKRHNIMSFENYCKIND